MNILLTKKAAMFGLDARIALAIFGALSVISGAALYSAIQQSKVIGFITTGQEAFKAIESYMLDTGQDLPADDNHTRVRKYLELESSSVAGWAGPYTAYTPHGGVTYSMILYGSKNGYIEMLNDKTWGDTASLVGTEYCVADDNDCYYWLTYVNIEDSIAQAMMETIDGSDTPTTGNVRLIDSANAGQTHVYVKGPRMLSQP